MLPELDHSSVSFSDATKLLAILFASKLHPTESVYTLKEGLLDPSKSAFVAEFFSEDGIVKALYEIEQDLNSISGSQIMVDKIKRDKTSRILIEERYIQPMKPLEYLLSLPPNTLGLETARNRLEYPPIPQITGNRVFENDIDYVVHRLDETHDIFHIVTNMDRSSLGEITLKVFELAQFQRPLSIILISSYFLNTLYRYPENLPLLIELVKWAYAAGLKAEPLFAVKWENYWESDLDELRQSLHIAPAPECVRYSSALKAKAQQTKR